MNVRNGAHLKLFLATFILSCLLLLFNIARSSTDVYQASVLSGLEPWYLLSLVTFSLLFVNWQKNISLLAIVSFLYEALITSVPYSKFTFLYASVYDNMYHYALSERILTTGHLPQGEAYTGFTTFHSAAVVASQMSGLPLLITFKLLLSGIPILVQLAAFWISLRVLSKESTRKLAVLTGMIAYVAIGSPGPHITAAFFATLTIAIILEFGSTASSAARRSSIYVLIIIVTSLVMTHHATAFFTIIGLIGTGILLSPLRDSLKSAAKPASAMLSLGLLALGFGYLWWTYYARFTDLLQSIASLVSNEQIGFQSPIGRGVSYYGPLVWFFRTAIAYAQRGQAWFYTVLGLSVSLIFFSGRLKKKFYNAESHAVTFLFVCLFLTIWAFFLFIPYFVIGPERFFNFAFLVAPSIMAAGIEFTYSIILRAGRAIGTLHINFFRHFLPRAIIAFVMVSGVFTEFTGQIFLGSVSAASSQYQYSQIAFLDQHSPQSIVILSHTTVQHQMQAYATRITEKNFEGNIVTVLFSLYSNKPLPSYAYGRLMVFDRVGPAGFYFEAAIFYPNSTWVPLAVGELLSIPGGSIPYNSGEAFIEWSG